MLKHTHSHPYMHICTPPCISDISPMLPLKQFRCGSFIEDGPFPLCVFGGGGGGGSVFVGVWKGGIQYTGMEVRKEYQFKQSVLGKKTHIILLSN